MDPPLKSLAWQVIQRLKQKVTRWTQQEVTKFQREKTACISLETVGSSAALCPYVFATVIVPGRVASAQQTPHINAVPYWRHTAHLVRDGWQQHSIVPVHVGHCSRVLGGQRNMERIALSQHRQQLHPQLQSLARHGMP
jgi:hypothetical protein